MVSRLLFGIGLLILLAGPASAGQLPVRRWSTEQGLPHDSVSMIARDSRGFFWVGTSGGLSRFDGHGFRTYSTAHGLPAKSANGIVENPDGTYWVSGWWNGIAHFDPDSADPGKLFVPVTFDEEPRARTHTVHRDRNGRVWIGTTVGLLGLDTSTMPPSLHRVEPDPSSTVRHISRIWNLTDDRRGNLWMATADGLVRRSPDGRVALQPVVADRAVEVYSVLEARDGKIWAGHDDGVTLFDPGDPDDARHYSAADGIGDGVVTSLLQSSDGRIWLTPVKGGLTEFDGERFHHYTPTDGLGFALSRCLAEDGMGNIWIGSLDRGIARLARTGVTAFAEAEGLDFSSYASIVEDRDGRIVITAGSALFRLDGERFHKISPPFLAGHTTGRMGQNAIILVDRDGGWWFGTTHGLYRFRDVDHPDELATRDPEVVDLHSAGLPADAVTALFEDSAGNVWIGVQAAAALGRREAATGLLDLVDTADGLPAAAVTSIAEDREGNLWFGSRGGLGRRREGKFETFTSGQGLAAPPVVFDLHADARGRLWISTVDEGIYRVDEPWVERPVFEHYTTADGLANRYGRDVVDDRFGQIWVGTNAGINRLDPASGRVGYFDTNFGLSNNEIRSALRDRDGTLWFTSRRGVSRVEPRPPSYEDPPPPRVLVTGVRVAGKVQPVSVLGQARVTDLRIAAGDNRVEIDFGSIAFDLGGEPRYQYKLEGADRDWTVPTALRSVHFARLAPGGYRFAVRAVDTNGAVSEIPAIVEFRVLRPLWQQGWFVSAVAALLVACGYLIHRYRLGRMLELERVRMRIATDLHDDLGSNLSRIAILSEVLQRRVDPDDPSLTGPLSRIAGVARELVDSMGDIVWAINPRRDRMSDLVHRMRRFASDTLAAREIDFVFHAPKDEDRLKLGADVRREVYLVFKESINNAAKHAGCSHVEVDFGVEGSLLSLRVRDDGEGFTPDETDDGHGLDSMRRRGSRLGGTLLIDSRPGEGTVVSLRVPLRTAHAPT
jgi:ligand-binding sensor domain-containing protein/signal transduction histidine kinase